MILENQVLQERLVCPKTKSPLSYQDGMLVSLEGKQYPVIEGTPIFLDKLPKQLEEKGKQAFIKTKYGRSWMLNHYEDLGIRKLIGPSTQAGTKMLCIGGGDQAEKEAMQALGYEVVALEVNPLDGIDVVGDAHYLPFPDNTFDIVTSWEVFEHLHSPWLAIQEVNRVLKKGGRFVGSVAFMKGWHGSYFHMSHWGVHSLLTQHGFEINQLYGGQNFVVHTIGKYLPNKLFGSRKILLRLYNGIYNLATFIRLSGKKLVRRENPEQIMVQDGIFEVSYSKYYQLMVSATILFSSNKVAEWSPFPQS